MPKFAYRIELEQWVDGKLIDERDGSEVILPIAGGEVLRSHKIACDLELKRLRLKPDDGWVAHTYMTSSSFKKAELACAKGIITEEQLEAER